MSGKASTTTRGALPGLSRVALAFAVAALLALAVLVAPGPDGVAPLLPLPDADAPSWGAAWSSRVAPADRVVAGALAESVRHVGAGVAALALLALLTCLLPVVGLREAVRPSLSVRWAVGASPRALVRGLIVGARPGVARALAWGVVVGILAAGALRLAWPLDGSGRPPSLLLVLLVPALLLPLGLALASPVAGLEDRSVGLLRTGSGGTDDPRAGTVRRATATIQLAAAAALVLAGLTLGAGRVAFDPRTGGDASAGGDTLLVPLRPQAAGVDWGAVERMLGAVAPESLSTPGAWTGRGVSDMVTVECGNCVRGTLLLPMYGVHAIVHAVSPGFFDGAGIAVLEGRGFEPGDAGEAPRVAVVSVPFRRHFEGGRPLGKRILLGGGGDRWVRVVGVVEPLPYQAPGSATPEQPVLYVPLAQHPAGEVVWARPQGREPLVPVRAPVRTAGEAATLRAVRAEARAPVRWVGRALLTAGALGLVLALAGAAEVARAEARGRWREAAVRASLGAPPRRLALRFLRRVAGTAVLGAGIGWILAWGVVGSVGRGASIRPLEGALLAALLFAASLAGAARAAGRVATADPAVLMRDGG